MKDSKTKDDGKDNLDKIMKGMTSAIKIGKKQADAKAKGGKALEKQNAKDAVSAQKATDQVAKKTEDSINKMLGIKKDKKVEEKKKEAEKKKTVAAKPAESNSTAAPVAAAPAVSPTAAPKAKD